SLAYPSPMPLRPVERFLGLALASLGWWITAGAWHDASLGTPFSLAAALSGPALTLLGLGITFFRAERSALLDLLHLRTKWIALVLLALLVGALDVGHLLGW
ncbi:MAG: hypothetical protein ACREOE_05585, partial [Gemmatimonadales bacterium]